MTTVLIITAIIVLSVLYPAYLISRRSHRRGRAAIKQLLEHVRTEGEHKEFNDIIQDEDEGPTNEWIGPL
jgi:hypothetical protein